MKLVLVKIKGKLAGYNLLPENKPEQQALDEICKSYNPEQDEDEMMRYSGVQLSEKTVSEMSFLRLNIDTNDIHSLRKIGGVNEIEVKEKPGGFYYCPECKSRNVQIKAWVRPNEGNSYAGDVSDMIEAEDCWCEDCAENVELKSN